MAEKKTIEIDFNELDRESQLKALEKMAPKDRKFFEKDLKPEEKKEPKSDDDYGVET